MSFPIPSHIEEDAPSKPQESLPGDDIDAVVKTESVNIPVTLDTRGGSAPGILHFSEKDTPVSGAVVLLSGARGGLDGPSGTFHSHPRPLRIKPQYAEYLIDIYPSLANKLVLFPILGLT